MLKQDEIQLVIDEVVSRVVTQLDQNELNTVPNSQVLQARVITTSQVPAQGGSDQDVIVRQDAVITPAALDLFRDRGLQVKRVPVQRQTVTAGSGNGCLVTVSLDATVHDRLRSQFEDIQSLECIVQAGKQIAQCCSDGDRVVLVTPAVEVALVAVSRHQTLRPVELKTSDTEGNMQQRCESVAANVLVISSEMASHWKVPRIVRQFLARQYTAVPSWL